MQTPGKLKQKKMKVQNSSISLDNSQNNTNSNDKKDQKGDKEQGAAQAQNSISPAA